MVAVRGGSVAKLIPTLDAVFTINQQWWCLAKWSSSLAESTTWLGGRDGFDRYQRRQGLRRNRHTCRHIKATGVEQCTVPMSDQRWPRQTCRGQEQRLQYKPRFAVHISWLQHVPVEQSRVLMGHNRDRSKPGQADHKQPMHVAVHLLADAAQTSMQKNQRRTVCVNRNAGKELLWAGY